jgi:release factor glutamine methyltransferase
MVTSILGYVAAAELRLRRAGLSPDGATLDAEFLARYALGWNRAAFLTRRGTPAPEAFGPRYHELVARRELREPVSLITRQREFWGLNFAVTPDVLTPRPETELLVEETLTIVREKTGGGSAIRGLRIADVGTGSGCIAIALAHELGATLDSPIIAIDPSAAALAVARQNADRHGVSGHVEWREGSLLHDLPRAAGLGFDLIAANLPYVSDGEFHALAPEVRDFEPRLALAGGHDGLDVIRALIDQVSSRPTLLARTGHVLLEIGAGQIDAVRAQVSSAPDLSITKIRDDLQQIPRVVVIEKEPADA